MPKRTTKLANGSSKIQNKPKELSNPKKFSAFSSQDSQALETKYQKLLEGTEERVHQSSTSEKPPGVDAFDHHVRSEEDSSATQIESVSVPVNEDYLFDVNIEQRELLPVYWLGPVYEGTLNHIPKLPR